MLRGLQNGTINITQFAPQRMLRVIRPISKGENLLFINNASVNSAVFQATEEAALQSGSYHINVTIKQRV
jgi:hypothetical protein